MVVQFELAWGLFVFLATLFTAWLIADTMRAQAKHRRQVRLLAAMRMVRREASQLSDTFRRIQESAERAQLAFAKMGAALEHSVSDE